jgi:hypothetical protein
MPRTTIKYRRGKPYRLRTTIRRMKPKAAAKVGRRRKTTKASAKDDQGVGLIDRSIDQ